ncbi:hypothetical protein HKD37_14G039734 [Glycine soja]
MVLVTLPKLTNEEHRQCCEMAKIMLKVAVPPDTILNTVNAKDQYVICCEVERLVYNQDLDKSTIVTGWTTLRNFYHLTRDHQVLLTHYGRNPTKIILKMTLIIPSSAKFYHFQGDVPSTMYYFLKDKGGTHLHLEDVAECRLMFNHGRKTLKIGVGWKYFCETLSLKAGMKIVFEFIDPTVNHVLFWPCL